MNILIVYFIMICISFIGEFFCTIASWRSRHVFRKYSGKKHGAGISGRDVAVRILTENGLKTDRLGVGNSDYYMPKKRKIVLSRATWNGTGLSSVAYAAHECGHAIQHKRLYFPYIIWSLAVKCSGICNRMWMCVLILSIAFKADSRFIYIGLLMMSWDFVFSIVNLPVERNASKRAEKLVEGFNIMKSKKAKKDFRKILRAAYGTYVTHAVMSGMQCAFMSMVILGGI